MLTKAQRNAWAKALRSGEYNQTTKYLYRETEHEYTDNLLIEHEAKGFCCLGVYCHAVLGTPTDTLHGLEMPGAINEEYPEFMPFEEMKPESQFTAILYDLQMQIPMQFVGQKYNPNKGTNHTTNAGDFFALVNDEFEWSFNRIANVVDHLPVRD